MSDPELDLNPPPAGDRCPKCGTERAVVGYCAVCQDGETIELPAIKKENMMQRVPDWQLAEKLAVIRQKQNPEVLAAVQQLGLPTDHLAVTLILQLQFRDAVLSELERFEPERMKVATRVVSKRMEGL